MTSKRYMTTSLRVDALDALKAYADTQRNRYNANHSELILAGILALKEHGLEVYLDKVRDKS